MTTASVRAQPRGLTFSEASQPLAVPARRAVRELAATNGSKFGKSNYIIRIPLNVRAFIDTAYSFLMFEHTVTLPNDDTATGANCPNKDLVFDGGSCAALFSRMQILGSDNSTIEDVNDYALLMSCILKCATPLVFQQAFMQAVAGAPGLATNPIPAISNGGDTAVPFNPNGRHATVKAETDYANTGSDFFNSATVFTSPANMITGPLADLAITYATVSTNHNAKVHFRSGFYNPAACSIESAGPEQWLAYQAGLGMSRSANPRNNVYQAYTVISDDNVWESSDSNPLKSFSTGSTLDDDSKKVIAALTLASSLNTGKPKRCCNRGAVGISGIQLADQLGDYTVLNDPPTLVSRAAISGTSNLNSRSNPLSSPSWAGCNHARVIGAMGVAAKPTPKTGTAGNNTSSLYEWIDMGTLAEQETNRKYNLSRKTELHTWDPDFMDATAEMAYNDWFAYQHTAIKQCGPALLISDGTSNPCPLISYVGRDSSSSSSPLVIRYDKARTKGCQNLSDRVLLGHAPSQILFNQLREDDDLISNPASTDKAVAQCIKRTYMLPLLSGLLNNPKYFPAQFISGGGVVIQLHLQRSPFSIYKVIPDQPTPLEQPCTNGFKELDYEVTNPRYRCTVVNFEEDLNETFAQVIRRGGLVWSGQSWRSHSNNFQTTEQNVTLSFTERLTSVKGMFATFRPQPYVDGDHRMIQVNTNASYRCGIKQYRWKIGSMFYPDTFVDVQTFDWDKKYPGYPFPRTDVGAANSQGGMMAVDFGDHYDNQQEGLTENCVVGYTEILSLFGKLANVNAQHNYLIEDYQRECKIAGKQGTPHWSTTELNTWGFEDNFSPYDCEFQKGMFLVGICCETFPQDSGVIQSGINTAASALNIDLYLTRTNITAKQVVNVNLFVLFDQAYSITPQGTLVAAQ